MEFENIKMLLMCKKRAQSAFFRTDSSVNNYNSGWLLNKISLYLVI
jgi:hypothetical protein